MPDAKAWALALLAAMALTACGKEPVPADKPSARSTGADANSGLGLKGSFPSASAAR